MTGYLDDSVAGERFEGTARLEAEGADVNATDGVRVNTADGWWLLRASNTQDVLVARCEATSADGLERLKGILASQLEASGVHPPDDFQHQVAA